MGRARGPPGACRDVPAQLPVLCRPGSATWVRVISSSRTSPRGDKPARQRNRELQRARPQDGVVAAGRPQDPRRSRARHRDLHRREPWPRRQGPTNHEAVLAPALPAAESEPREVLADSTCETVIYAPTSQSQVILRSSSRHQRALRSKLAPLTRAERSHRAALVCHTRAAHRSSAGRSHA